MSPLGTWVLGILFIGVLCWLAWSINYLLDIMTERAHRKRVTDPTPIYRRDHALDVMASWQPAEVEDDPEMLAMLDRALETPGVTVVFERGEDGVIREVDPDGTDA